MWQDFNKLLRKNAKGKDARYGVVCLHCHKQYSGASSGGTSHLRRHRAKCPKRLEKNRSLKHLFPHKDSFTTFIHANYPRRDDGVLLITEEHWTVAEKVLKFLELFYDSTVALFGVYYPMAPLMIYYLVKIATHLKTITMTYLCFINLQSSWTLEHK